MYIPTTDYICKYINYLLFDVIQTVKNVLINFSISKIISQKK